MSASTLRNSWKLATCAMLAAHGLAQSSSLQERTAEGLKLEGQGAFAQAERIFRDAASEAEHTGRPVLLAAALDGIASVDRDRGRYLEAESLLLRALALVERATGADSESTAKILWHLSGVYAESGRPSAAEPFLKRYEHIVMSRTDADSVQAADDLGNLGRIYFARNAAAKALPLFERAVAILERQPKGNDIAMARALLDRASVYAILGRASDAASDVERAGAVAASLSDSFPVLKIDLESTAGTVYTRAHRAEEADAAFQEGIRIAESAFGPSHPFVAMVFKSYSQSLHVFGRKKEAAEYEKRASRILAANHFSNPVGHVVDVEALRQR